MKRDNPQRGADLSDDAALRLVIEGTVAETGTEFFRALVRNLSRTLGTLGAWITEYLPEEQRLRSYAMWMGEDFVDHYDYPLKGTACAEVVANKTLVHIPDRLVELFPQDTDLVPLDAMSYLGMPLLGTDGEVLGHLGVLDNKPMPRDERAISLFEIFAARAAGELRRIKAMEQVQAREEQLSLLLSSAMDSILVLDAGLKIVRINPSAERLFGCTEEDLTGECLTEFLTRESALQLRALVSELESLPAGRQQIWVPHDFVVRRWDHSVFPAEVTLSRFVNRNEIFHTLILRNADERGEAEQRLRLLAQETEYLREAVRDVPGHGELLGSSDCMQAVIDAIQRVAPTDSTVLVTGETGTGKELVARSIHRASRRAEKPLVLVNCAAIPANLIESEFFGHERGAFTGAVSKREGRFALADGGTIFLDEIGELPLELQAKLLRVLQEGEIQPLGSSKVIKVDVRVVAATNRDLKKMVNVFPIAIPPLRERGRDLEHLANSFTQRFARRMGRRLEPLGGGQLECLRGYDWPGNVRELQNIIERAVILSNGPELALDRAMAGSTTPPDPFAKDENASRVLTVAEMEDLERANLRRALDTCGGKVSGDNGAARLLGIPPTTLSSRMKALGVARVVA